MKTPTLQLTTSDHPHPFDTLDDLDAIRRDRIKSLEDTGRETLAAAFLAFDDMLTTLPEHLRSEAATAFHTAFSERVSEYTKSATQFNAPVYTPKAA
jgi:hypothetical protein